MKKALTNIFNFVIDFLVVVVLVVSILVVIMSVGTRATGVANVFGYTPFTVQTNSMEPIFYSGDVLISKAVNQDSYKVNDIVTYWTTINGMAKLNTHKIVEVTEINGTTCYITKGENIPDNDERPIVAGDIVAIYTGTRIPYIGKFLDYVQTQSGFFICVLLPMIVFFLYQLYRFVQNLIAYNKEKAREEAEMAVQNMTVQLTDEQKQQAVQEYLDSLNKNNENNE